MPDEASTPKNAEDSVTGQAPPPQSADAAGQAADPPSLQATDGQSTQAPPLSTEGGAGQASEPAPVSEPTPAEALPASETAQPEIAPVPEAYQTESATEAPSGAVEAPRASENLEAVIDTTPQNTSVPPESRTAQTVPVQSTTSVIRPHGDLVIARAKIQATKRKKLDKIMAAIEGKGPTTLKLRRVNAITNDEVEKLLRVSDATATRYLQTLEKENRIKQTGKTGAAVFYKKI